ncbi:MAG: phage tail sheath subtilisin-like domain-containing protein [Halobacteriaceae archaeon]
MAFDYGSKDEPGIVSDVNSLTTVNTGSDAPDNPGVVGQADLTNGDAIPNTVYEIIEDTTAVQQFGENSLLTNAVLDALNEGADVVYAVAPEMISVTAEDLSGLTSTNGTLANAPPTEVAGDITFTINGSTLNTSIVYEDVSGLAPGTDEAYVQADTGDFNLDGNLTIGNTGDEVNYEYADYSSALTALENGAAQEVDHLAALNENDSVTSSVQTTASNLATEQEFLVAYAGMPLATDPSAFTNSYDDSRLALLGATRKPNGDSALGGYLGLRSNIGINTTPINKTLKTVTDLKRDLDSTDRKLLIAERVIPLSLESGGVRIVDDINTVSDTNTQEQNIRFVYSRLVTDYILDTVRKNEQPFIGKLNDPDVRGTLEGLLTNEIRALEKQNQVISYDLEVVPVDATTARLRMDVNLSEPLRFIENVIGIGN